MNKKIIRLFSELVILILLISAVVFYVAYSKGYDSGQEDLKNEMNDFRYFEFRFSEINPDTNKMEIKFAKRSLEVYAENWCINAINQQGGQR